MASGYILGCTEYVLLCNKLKYPLISNFGDLSCDCTRPGPNRCSGSILRTQRDKSVFLSSVTVHRIQGDIRRDRNLEIVDLDSLL